MNKLLWCSITDVLFAVDLVMTCFPLTFASTCITQCSFAILFLWLPKVSVKILLNYKKKKTVTAHKENKEHEA